jgi:hypothetical protein
MRRIALVVKSSQHLQQIRVHPGRVQHTANVHGLFWSDDIKKTLASAPNVEPNSYGRQPETFASVFDFRHPIRSLKGIQSAPKLSSTENMILFPQLRLLLSYSSDKVVFEKMRMQPD